MDNIIMGLNIMLIILVVVIIGLIIAYYFFVYKSKVNTEKREKEKRKEAKERKETKAKERKEAKAAKGTGSDSSIAEGAGNSDLCNGILIPYSCGVSNKSGRLFKQLFKCRRRICKG